MLDTRTPAFRANLFVPEGARAGVAVLNMPNGVVLQDLRPERVVWRMAQMHGRGNIGFLEAFLPPRLPASARPPGPSPPPARPRHA